MTSIFWLVPAAGALAAATFAVILPAYTILLAGITLLRARWPTRGEGSDDGGGAVPPWGRIRSSLFQGRVFHIRHRPTVHSFNYPLYFSVVDLDEACELFGAESVIPQPSDRHEAPSPRGKLWPLSSLMLLRDSDHLKNGEGLRCPDTKEELQNASLRERVLNLVHERTNGRVDLRSGGSETDNQQRGASGRRRILLVTHLMYYGYCFNPVSFYFILQPEARSRDRRGNEDEEEVEAIVVEVSNTPWNEMSVYVLHPDSADMTECHVCPPTDPSSDMHATTYRYKWNKNFHVSPFMTMDHGYDWTFQMCRDRIKAQVKLIKRGGSSGDHHGDATNPSNSSSSSSSNDDDDGDAGTLYFTGGFDIQRRIQPTTTYPLQLAKVIGRFPIYCVVIQLWIHYEAVRLLTKGVQFIPHPEGSESGASRAIAAVMGPVFAAMDVVDGWWGQWKGRGKKGKID